MRNISLTTYRRMTSFPVKGIRLVEVVFAMVPLTLIIAAFVIGTRLAGVFIPLVAVIAPSVLEVQQQYDLPRIDFLGMGLRTLALAGVMLAFAIVCGGIALLCSRAANH